MRATRVIGWAAVAATAYAAGRRSRPRTTAEEPAGRIGGGPVPGGSPHEIPGVTAQRPTDIPGAGWRQILRRAARETKQDDILLIAAGVAFYAFLGLFPALIAAVTLYGLIADPAQVQEQVRSVADALPPESARLLAGQLTDIATSSQRALGVGLVVSLAGALFSASGAVANLIKAINVAYDEEETRSFIRLRAVALAFTLGAVVFVAVSVGLIAFLPVALDHVGLGATGRLAAGGLRWVGLVVFVAAALAVVYRYAPDRDRPRFSWVSLGAGAATVLWVLASAGFSVYVRTFGNYSKTYGTLAGVIVLMLWLYLTALIVLLGAEINSETEQQTASDSTVGPTQPMGDRGAVKADTLPAMEPTTRRS